MAKPFILGADGKLGSALSQRFNIPGIGFQATEKGYKATKTVLQNHPNATLVITVAAEFQVEVHEKLFDLATETSAKPTLINTNSVQDQVTKALEYRMSDIPTGITLVGLHPHHGHPLTAETEIHKNWLLTYAKRWDRQKQKEKSTLKVIRNKLNQHFKQAGISDITVVDLDEAATALPHFRNGADLHDTLTAYSQALVHMLRLIVDNDELFFTQFVSLNVSPSLSRSIVEQNPYAREGVYRKLKDRAPFTTDLDFITKLQTLALDFAQEYETRFSGMDPTILDAVKTPKFKELIAHLEGLKSQS